MNTEITYTTVDTDALDFLKVIYFGVITNPYEAASNNNRYTGNHRSTIGQPYYTTSCGRATSCGFLFFNSLY